MPLMEDDLLAARKELQEASLAMTRGKLSGEATQQLGQVKRA